MNHLQTLNCHGVTQVEIKACDMRLLTPDRKIGTEWVKIEMTDESGHVLTINLFFDQPHQREMFLEQIGQKVLV